MQKAVRNAIGNIARIPFQKWMPTIGEMGLNFVWMAPAADYSGFLACLGLFIQTVEVPRYVVIPIQLLHPSHKM
jgi:hypothetical protein